VALVIQIPYSEKGIIVVELRKITKENYEECLNLSVADDQKKFVSSNVHSLAQAWVYYDTAFPFAIYADNVMVGFIMLGYYEVRKYYTMITGQSWYGWPFGRFMFCNKDEFIIPYGNL